MSVASEIQRLQTAKADIKTAIENKGVTVDSSLKLDDYPQKIAEISGGGGQEEAPENDVNFYDYDGFRVASYTIAEAKALTQAEYNAILPPTHQGLTFQDWNWTLNDITTYNRRYIDVGANYKTTDGKTHIKIHVDNNGDIFSIRYLIVTYQLTIKWGDGSEDVVSSNNTITHTYSTKGKYEIVIENNIENDNSSWEFNALNTLTYTQGMIDEILLDEKAIIKDSSIKYVKGIVSLPVGCLRDGTGSATFQYANIPMVTIPRGSSGITSSVVFSVFCGRLSFPKSIASTAVASIFFGSVITRIVLPEQTINNFNNTYFQGNTILEIISIPNDFNIASNGTNIFNYSNKLKYLDIVQGWVPNNNLTLSGSSFWSPNALVDFLTKLGTTTNAITLTFGATNLAKIPDSIKTEANTKGYTLA